MGTGSDASYVSPLLVLHAHAHWALVARYNPFHDQLLLTAGSDCTLRLWRAASVSSSAVSVSDAPPTSHATIGSASAAEALGEEDARKFANKRIQTQLLIQSRAQEQMQQQVKHLIKQAGGAASAGTQVHAVASAEAPAAAPFGGAGAAEGDVEADSAVLSLPADEALYGAAWSAKDAWVMAGLSADGRVFVSHVPSSEKYKILL